MPKLKKELSLFALVFYGVGVIIGAGIYVLMGHATAVAGSGVWLSFIIAAIIASFTGLSYAELSSMYPRDAAEYTYVKNAFKSTTTGFVIGWLTFFMMIIGSAVVSLGFGQYLYSLTGISITIGAVALILAFAVINYLGIRISSRLNIILTSITLLGMFIIIFIGAPYIGSVNYFEMPNGLLGVFGAAAIIFFAYLGFDEIVNTAEEAKNARKNVPRAIVISVIITTIIYILVSLSTVSAVPWQEVGASSTPLALVASKAFGSSAGYILSIFALFATASTALILMIAGSRMLFGMAEYHVVPKFLLKIDRKRKTPYMCILLITLIALGLVAYSEIKSIALLVDFSAFFTFAFINLSVLILRFTDTKTKRMFKVPVNIGRVPLLPVLGFLISSYMLLQFELNLAWIAVMIMIAGYLFHKFFEAERRVQAH